MTEALTELLREMDYKANLFRLTTLMREVPTGLDISENSYVNSTSLGLPTPTRSASDWA